MSDKHNSALRRASSGTRTEPRGSVNTTTTTNAAASPDGSSGSRRSRRPPLPLSPALRTRQAREIQARVQPHLAGAALEVTITNNRSVMISVNRQPRHRRYGVRLHHMFVDAPDALMEHLARYILHNDRAASRALGQFIDRQPSPGSGERRTVIRTAGRHHDLAEMFDRLNQRYFDGELTCRITWGRHAARGKARRVVRLGSYTLEQDLIRLHPGLDQEWVPEFFVEWVVFHEMLHAAMPPHRVNGRRRFHTRELREAEQRYEHHDRASAWEKANIAALLSI